MRHSTCKLEDGREWLTDGISGIECHAAIKLLGIFKELSACNCTATIIEGMLVLEDGTSYD